MNDPAEMIRSTLADAAWLAHRYDSGYDAVHFVKAARSDRATIPFLTDEYLPAATQPRVIARSDARQASPDPGRINFIFHSAYCCSTLLAAACERPGKALAIKEPQILNDMVGWRLRGADPARLSTVMNDALALLARPFVPGEQAVIKPSNTVNGLIEALLALRPESHAMLLHAPLRIFLVSIARKGLWGRLWVRELFATQLAEGQVDLGFADRDLMRLTDLQVAAAGWLVQQQLFHRLLGKLPGRIRSLDSEALIAAPERTMRALDAHFSLGLEADEIGQTVREVFARDTKTGESFTAGRRDADREAGERLHADEIDKVFTWAESVAANAGIALTLPGGLLEP